MGAVESDSVKSARKAEDKLHNPVKERQKLVSELYMRRNKTMRMASRRESRVSDRFLVNTQVQSHALLRRGFGTSVPFIIVVSFFQMCSPTERYQIDLPKRAVGSPEILISLYTQFIVAPP